MYPVGLARVRSLRRQACVSAYSFFVSNNIAKMESSSFVDMLTRLGRPSTVINGANEAQALVLAHTLTTHLRNKFESLIRAHPHRPILKLPVGKSYLDKNPTPHAAGYHRRMILMSMVVFLR